jgi:hypothetical protein
MRTGINREPEAGGVAPKLGDTKAVAGVVRTMIYPSAWKKERREEPM